MSRSRERLDRLSKLGAATDSVEQVTLLLNALDVIGADTESLRLFGDEQGEVSVVIRSSPTETYTFESTGGSGFRVIMVDTDAGDVIGLEAAE